MALACIKSRGHHGYIGDVWYYVKQVKDISLRYGNETNPRTVALAIQVSSNLSTVSSEELTELN